MTLNNYQSAAMDFSPEGHDRIHYGCMGLMGECGEIVDVVKKMTFRPDGPVGIKELIEELGDVMWYLAELATGLGIDLSKEMDRKDFKPMNYRRDTVEKYAVTMLSLSVKCYDYGYIHGRRDQLINCMRKIYACARMIGQVNGIPLRTILEENIGKQKRRYLRQYN